MRKKNKFSWILLVFFVGQPTVMAKRVWEESGWNGKYALETLRNRCLVEEFSLHLKMHDHLRDLGRELALELSSPRRLWRPQDLKSLELMGVETIPAKTNARCFNSIFDESTGSQVTFFLGHSDICVETSASVLWLQLEGNFTELPSFPSWISLQKLHCLKIEHGRLKTLWENRIQAPSHLKELIIVECHELEEMTSLSRVSCMENIEVHGCEKLLSITLPTTLSNLSVGFCRNLRRVSGTGDLMELKKVIVWECPKLEEFPSLYKVSCMENIEVDTCVKLLSLTLPTKLFSLSLQYCRDLQRVSGTSDFTELKQLTVRTCLQFEELPSLFRVSCMENIEFDTCEKLQSITLPTILFTLSLQNCRNLQRVSEIGDLMELMKLTIRNCPDLEKLPWLSGVSHMGSIEVDTCEKLQSITFPRTLFCLSLQNCRNLQRVSGIGGLMELKKMTVRECLQLEELPSLSRVNCMENIEVDTCEKLPSITLPTRLFTLSLQNCRNLQRVSRISDLMELKKLTVRECLQLEELPSLTRVSCMENIDVDTCEKLQSIPNKTLHPISTKL